MGMWDNIFKWTGIPTATAALIRIWRCLPRHHLRSKRLRVASSTLNDSLGDSPLPLPPVHSLMGRVFVLFGLCRKMSSAASTLRQFFFLRSVSFILPSIHFCNCNFWIAKAFLQIIPQNANYESTQQGKQEISLGCLVTSCICGKIA